ncbi:MAG: ACT domain-containing protein [Acidimicrobiia bacterium]|nr:ACT domain-containing protein [Acidimicrobiia bacterium]MBT8191943.1 ACT domain-containing protein [Acidimicrobiia bacterium]MBT8248338.1 ACT domain-containing protein [Acidimicrobiia bacterium]NNF87564.1 ACT domain-containing protein [Acidimicrobiia bacterium]NNJ46766.1 ACT domain-containing protein [Acidimicrobiia bacterium]
MRILVADKFPESGLAHLRENHDVEFQPGLAGDDLPDAIGDSEVLIVRSTNVTAATIEAGSSLALVVRAGAGTNTIDKQAAADHAVYVSNVPGRNAIAVAELTLGLILAIDRRIPDNVADLRSGSWNKATYSKGTGLLGRSLGIVGVGAIGMAVATRAASFGLELHAVDKPRDPVTAERMEDLGFVLHPSLAAMAAGVDILSFHVPATADTRNLLNAELLTAVRPGTVIVNTSRADVVDEAALLEVIDEKELWVALDVFAGEPASGQGDVSSPLGEHARVYATHHIGASTAQAQAAVATGVLEVIDAFADGVIVNCVNLEPRVPDTTRIAVRHKDRVGVLAAILTVIRDAGINVEHMSNLVFQGAKAASATLDLKGSVEPELLARLAEIPDVIYARRTT